MLVYPFRGPSFGKAGRKNNKRDEIIEADGLGDQPVSASNVVAVSGE